MVHQYELDKAEYLIRTSNLSRLRLIYDLFLVINCQKWTEQDKYIGKSISHLPVEIATNATSDWKMKTDHSSSIKRKGKSEPELYDLDRLSDVKIFLMEPKNYAQ